MRSSLPHLFLISLTCACVGDLKVGSFEETPTTEVGGVRGPRTPPVPVPVVVAPSPAQIRVLSAPEYRNTVRDLLGLTASATLNHADWTGGFDNGAAIQIDQNLFSALMLEGETLGQQYVATRISADFACFSASDITDDCVRTIVEQLGRKAWRRPLTTAQRDELFTFFGSVATAVGNKTMALETLIARLITAPQFLYRTEVGHPVSAGSDRFALDAFEKASLISYTLTGTMPDALLLADAEAGLLDDAHLRAHIRRLWAAPQTRERQADFFRQWLKVTALDRMAKQPADFTKLTTPELGRSLKAEFDAYVGAVIFDGTGTLPALLSESFTFVDRQTAPLYGLTSTSDTAQRVALNPAERKGILTLASTMAAIASASDDGKDRPVLRGLMIKRQLLCEDVGPPSGINTVVASNTAAMIPNFDQLTTREQYEAMMQQGDVCAACHRQFMPLGFAFGRFDALGRYRTTQHGRPVNAAVSDVPLAGQVSAFTGAGQLVETLAASPTTASCFSKNFVKFALGSASSPNTETLSDSLIQQLGTEPLKVSRLVEETLASPHLYLRLATISVGGGMGGGAGGGTGAGGGGGESGGGGGSADAGVPVATRVLLAPGEELAPNASRVSGAFTLLYQGDGNLVLYRTNVAPIWSSGTVNETVGMVAMQGDGNLVVYNRDRVPKFNTGTSGNPGAALHIDGNGRLLILAPDGRTLWTSTGANP